MNKPGGFECVAWTWGIAALAGVFTAVALWVLGGWSFMQGAFMGVLVLIILGALLTITMCRGDSGTAGAGAAGASAAAGASGSATAASGTGATSGTGARSGAGATSGTGTAASGSAAAAGGAAAASGASAAAPAAASASSSGAASASAASSAPASETAAAPKKKAASKPKTSTKKAAPAAPAAEAPVVEESAPETLSGPRPGQQADDLKRISGVGPKLEGVLNDLGFYHFDQIAAWGPSEVAWVDSRLKFKGRIERDNWIDQAKAFAAEG